MAGNQKILVEESEYMHLMLECLSSEEYKKAIETLNPEARQSAMWDMAFCNIYASTHCHKYILDQGGPEDEI